MTEGYDTSVVKAARLQKIAAGYVARATGLRKEVRAIELSMTMMLLLLILWVTRR